MGGSVGPGGVGESVRRARRARLVTRVVLVVIAAAVVWLVPEEHQQHWTRTVTESAVQALDRLAFTSVAEYLREGLNECNYDWRLRCIPDIRRMFRIMPAPPPRPYTPLMRKLFTGERPTAEDYNESQRMMHEYEIQHQAFEAKMAQWQQARADAQAYEASIWKSLRPVLVGPGAVSHAVRQTYVAGGIGGVVGIGVSLALGALLVQFVPIGPFAPLLIPLAASIAAGVLGFGLGLVAKPLGWQGQSVTLLWVLWESGKRIWDTFEWAEQLERIVRFLRQRPIPHDAP